MYQLISVFNSFIMLFF